MKLMLTELMESPSGENPNGKNPNYVPYGLHGGSVARNDGSVRMCAEVEVLISGNPISTENQIDSGITDGVELKDGVKASYASMAAKSDSSDGNPGRALILLMERLLCLMRIA
ncbi:hypothetical protein V6N13_014775 [Hibiscus sabdariffa]|uniref:Uncharacterized protein n=1 Tax=Hibiscus sabdariffa TaxID=183260 RepID=A0ABR2RWF7_9ROSI